MRRFTLLMMETDLYSSLSLSLSTGNRFAIAQMRAVIVRLVQTFECVRLAPNAPPVRLFQVGQP